MSKPRNLTDFPLPAHVVVALNRADALAVCLERRGLDAPATITLPAGDYRDVDSIVRFMSRGRHGAGSVTWKGRALEVA